MIERRLQFKGFKAGEAMEIGKQIHEQLVGNKDYVNSDILLNVDGAKNECTLYVVPGIKAPEINIKF